MNEFITKLTQKFRGDIQSDSETLDLMSRDASLFEVKPQLVVFPKDAEDIKNLVRLVNAENAAGRQFSLTARAAGTDMTGGPLTESIVVSFTKYMNRIKEIAAYQEVGEPRPEKFSGRGDGYIVAEPGVFYRDFEKETLKKNLLLPTYPASRELCAIGGMAANNSGGEKSLRYGQTKDYIEEIKMVLADGNEYSFGALGSEELGEKKKSQSLEGEIYRKMHDLINQNYELIQSAKPKVSKNSAGYYLWDVFNPLTRKFNLVKLIAGSQGTLGIMTEVKLSLIKPKPYSRLLVIFLKDLKILPQLINRVLSFRPESFESYDDNALRVAVKIFSEIVKRLKGNMIMLAFRFLPEFWAVLTGGIPKLVMIAEFTGDTAEETKEKTAAAQNSLKEFALKTRVTKSEKEAQKYWVIRRESFNMLRHHIRGMRTAPFIDDIIVTPDNLPEFFPKLYALLGQYKIIYTVAGHMGDGNFHIIPLMDLKKPESKKIIFELAEKVYDLVLRFGGSITAEHNDGLIRGPYLEKMFGSEVFGLFKEVKHIFDPQGIFNPGKKTDVNLNFARSHIRTD